MSQDQLQYLRTSGESREEAMEIAILKILPKEIENAVRRRGKPFETAYLPDLDYTIKGEK